MIQFEAVMGKYSSRQSRVAALPSQDPKGWNEEAQLFISRNVGAVELLSAQH
jgi:hypothetical protein